MGFLPHTIQRACQLAMSAPRGPVFVSVPTEMLMETAAVEAPKAVLPAPVAADAGAIEALARALASASKPVIVVEELGRDVQAVAELVALAETLGAPVLDAEGSLRCLPHRHDTDGFYAARLVRQP